MADIPDQLICRRVKGVVQRNRQLDYSQPRAEMPARLRDRINEIFPYIRADGFQIAYGVRSKFFQGC